MDKEFLYGICGGFTGTLLSHPFDTIKTRIQTGNYKCILSAAQEGQLYKGLPAPLLGIMLEKSIVFGFYNKAKNNGFNNFWSGIIGGFASTVIVTPIDRIKIHIQNNNKYSSLKLTTLYKGFLPTIFRETPGFGIYFTTYNYLNTNNNNLYKSFLYGAASGFMAWLFIYPSDLIKTKNQSQQGDILQIIKSIYYTKPNYGLLNFYRGFSLAIMRAMPLHGGVFLGYELSKKYDL